MSNKRTTLLLNWYANPYHTPIFVAQGLGYYQQENIRLAILEATDPSDVTELVGLGKVDLGLKAMVHCFAARQRDFPICSVGTLLDEPGTGLIFQKDSGIKNFKDIRGKKLGYVGEFGKIIIDDLAQKANIRQDEYETIRVGMNITDAIQRGIVDAGIGLDCFQQIELEHYCGGATDMLRIDVLAELGCCCFCSIMFISTEAILAKHPEMVAGFMRANQRAMDYTIKHPEQAWAILCDFMPRLRTDLYEKIFYACLRYFSPTLLNIDRDWEKVAEYGRRLNIVPNDLSVQKVYTNQFIAQQADAVGV